MSIYRIADDADMLIFMCVCVCFIVQCTFIAVHSQNSKNIKKNRDSRELRFLWGTNQGTGEMVLLIKKLFSTSTQV